MPKKDHDYFDDADANNEVDAMRAGCRVMNEDNLWMFSQRMLLFAAVAQEIMMEKYPERWKAFNDNVENGPPKERSDASSTTKA